MPTQYRGLRAFCAAASMESFKDAADALCLSPSAISHQIRDLESYLGVRLFERHNRAIVLTPRGREYYEQIAPALRSIDLATNGMRSTPERVQLRIQMPEFFASELFVPRLSSFSERHGSVDIRIDSRGPDDPESPNADVHILLTRRLPDYPIREQLFPIRYVPACSAALHPCLAPAGPGVLEDATLLVHQARPHAWQQWAELAGVPAPHPRQLIRFDSMFALARAAEQGAGVALIPMPISGGWFQSGALKRLFGPDLTTRDFYWAAARQPGRQPEATALLIGWIVETFADFG